jgi:multidrug transporter EmrE-like cation transporter
LILNLDALKDKKNRTSYWLLPVLVWAGSCLVDLSLFLVERLNLADGENMEFTSTLFLSAACFGTLVLLYKLYTREKIMSVKSLMSGVLLGVPNFFSIYLILVLLERGWQGSALFPILNVTAILGSGIIGYLIFQEKLNLVKIIGFILVIISVVLLS